MVDFVGWEVLFLKGAGPLASDQYLARCSLACFSFLILNVTHASMKQTVSSFESHFR